MKKREWVQVDVAGKLIPTLWVIYDEYLRKLLPMTAVEKLKLERGSAFAGGQVGEGVFDQY